MRSPIAAGALGVAGFLFVGAAVVAWRRREAPASGLFAVVAGVAGGGALAVAGGLTLGVAHSLVVATVIVIGLLLPIPWLLFSFEYTGRTELVSTEIMVAVTAPASVGLAATGVIFGTQLLPWLRLPSRQTASGLTAVGVSLLSMTQWLTLLYTGGLVLAGTGIVLWTFHRYTHLDSSTGTLLGALGIVPWLSLLFGLQADGIASFALSRTVAVGFLVSGIVAGSLVGPYDLFGTIPAAGNVGPSTVIEDIEDIVVVTDGGGTVVELNAAAKRQLDVAATAVLGADIENLLNTPLEEIEGVETVELQSRAGRKLFEPTVSELTDQHGRLLGHAIVLRDVTDRTTRQQRLEVLNRVLRHNLSNKMTVVLSHADRLGEALDDPELVDSAEAIARAGDDLTQLSRTAREVEQILELVEADRQPIELAPLVEDVLAAATAGQRVSYEHDVPEGLVVEGQRDPLELALVNLVENAIEHNDSDEPSVEVSARYRPDRTYPLVVSVADDGPGIPENERRAIERGGETSLQHGSGLGLWAVRWVATSLGGTVEFRDREPRGTVVSLHLPRATRGEQTPGRASLAGQN